MPKCQSILPEHVRGRAVVELQAIPVNAYTGSVRQELESGALTSAQLLRVYRDMSLIRAFENTLDSVKRKGEHRGVKYDHRGPAHLSIGQEAAAVGQALHLDTSDRVYGSHRSHGEILAKGLSAIEALEEQPLMEIMTGYFAGQALRVVERDAHVGTRDLAISYLLYGALAEIFGREAGFNKGLGGSMHAFFPPFGVMPNNAIVGGSADIGVGAALFKRVHGQPGVVISNIGDAAAACGPTWEALCFATMDQYRLLWPEGRRGGLPFIMSFINNFYGMGGQPVGETMGMQVLARIGAGLNPAQLHAERVDGMNPLAVADAIRRKKALLAAGEGPVLLDTITYRISGHSPSDASSYRERAEVEAWRAIDPITTYGRELVAAGLADDGELSRVTQWAEDRVFRAYQQAIDLSLSPRADLGRAQCLLDQVMFSNQRQERLLEGTAEVLLPKADNPRVKQLAQRSRSGIGPEGEKVPAGRAIQIRDALFEAILDRFHDDPALIAYGEENRDWGGAFGVYRGLTESLPYHRLFNSPIAEGAIVGSAVGYAIEGGRALIELMYCDFMGRAGDELFNQLAKWQAMSGGLLRMPVVVRVSVGSKYGAQHSQDWSSLCAHVPGLKVVFPATPYDAKGLLTSALVGTDPVIFFESQRIYDMTEWFHPGGVPTESYELPFGEPDVKRIGDDVTILTVGATLYRALEAAELLERNWGVCCEVIDARSIVPFRYERVLESLRKTRKIVLSSDACERGSALHTMAAKLTTLAFDELDGPPVVVGARNWITPADEAEEAFFPFPVDIIDAVHRHLRPLPGYTPVRAGGAAELLRRERLGV